MLHHASSCCIMLHHATSCCMILHHAAVPWMKKPQADWDTDRPGHRPGRHPRSTETPAKTPIRHGDTDRDRLS